MRKKLLLAFVLVLIVQIVSVIVLATWIGKKNEYIKQMEDKIEKQTSHIQELEIQLWDLNQYLTNNP